MKWQSMTPAEACEKARTDAKQGLSENEAARRLDNFGYNRIEGKKQKGFLTKFISQFSDFMVLILLAAAGISFAVSLFSGDGDFIDPIIILAIVIINAIIGVVQESRAERAIEALKRISAPETHVLRGGKRMKIPAEEVVCGDILLLETGDLIAADARLLSDIQLKVEESALTGESVPSEKEAGGLCPEDGLIQNCKNMVYSSTVVTMGRGTAVAVATGMDTEVGKIARLINNEDTAQTPLQQKLAHTGKLLGIGCMIICGLIFLMGLFRHVPFLDTFMLSVSLAVAAIPEGLPAIVTIVLAMGVQKMAGKNAIIRRLPAVETLGGATVICSDKTGTLTLNRMTVTALANIKGEIGKNSDTAHFLLSLGTLCNNASLKRVDGSLEAEGDPTETAIVSACAEAGITKMGLESEFPRTAEIPFDSTRKMMTTIHKKGDGYRIIVKGAPDVLLGRSAMFLGESGAEPINVTVRNAVLKTNESMCRKALRVLGIAYRDVKDLPVNPEEGLCFAGLIGMIDPPRPDAKEAVRVCRRAGIKPVMITGDHAVTAEAIARGLGILIGTDGIMTGEELEKIDDVSLARDIHSYSVFARVSPEHKVRIVKAYKKNGGVVAMTGDGVNDAPALKAADIGCAMGKNGTEVAKSAADMILTDDNFSTIVSAVREGRGIFDNIKKAVHFLLSCNIGEILTIFVASLFGLPTPLLAIQLLWVNLVTDSLPALSIGMEPTESDVMKRKPADARRSLFAGGLGIDILLEGCMIGAFTLLAFLSGRVLFGIEAARTMAFAVLSFSQLVHAFNVRSEHSVFEIGIFSNKRMVASFIICAILQISVISVPALCAIFKTVPLSLLGWLIVLSLSLIPLGVMELAKMIGKRLGRPSFLPNTDPAVR